MKLMVVWMKHVKINYICLLCQYVNQSIVFNIMKNAQVRQIQGTLFARAGIPTPSSSCTPETLQNEIPARDFALQKQSLPNVYKKGILKNCLKLTGKHLYHSLYQMNFNFIEKETPDINIFVQIFRDF